MQVTLWPKMAARPGILSKRVGFPGGARGGGVAGGGSDGAGVAREEEGPGR